MGILGFSNLREEFSSETNNKLNFRKVISFDITHIVVKSIHSSINVIDFKKIFERKFFYSSEYCFIIQNSPLYLILTLDNKSPKAKKQTQLRRIINTTSTINRIINSRNKNYKKIFIKDIFHFIENFVNNLLKVKLPNTIIKLDYDEGEGEIKALNNLTFYNNMTKIIMSRDNDIFIYLLNQLDLINDNSDLIYVFFERSSFSKILLECWRNMPKGYGWLLIFWLGIIYGNDYTYGIFEKRNNKEIFLDIKEFFLHCCKNNLVEKRKKFIEGENFFKRNLIKAFDIFLTYLKNKIYYYDTNKYNNSNNNFNKDRIQNWFDRQIWSFAYSIELPNIFNNNFLNFPSIFINLDFPKYSINEKLLISLNRNDVEYYIINSIENKMIKNNNNNNIEKEEENIIIELE